MPVIIDGSTPANGRVSPAKQSLNWARGTNYPEVASLAVSSTNATLVEVSVQKIGTSVDWIGIDGYNGDSFYIDDFSASKTLPIVLKNLESLAGNAYKAVIRFTFSNYEGADKMVDVEINLAISGSFGPQTDKSNYNVVFNRANNALTGDTTVNILNNGSNSPLTFWQPSNIFEPKSGFTSGFTIQDNASASIANNPNIPVTGNVSQQCRLLDVAGNYISAFAINLTVLDDNGIGVNPSSVSFDVIKGTEKSVVLDLINPIGFAFTVEKSPWLQTSVNAGNTSMQITVTTSTDDLVAGSYNGFVNIKFANGTLVVPVSLLLRQFFTIGETLFCLDLKPVSFQLINPSAVHVKVSLSAVYNVMGKETVVAHSYSIPYVNEKASFDLGRKLHNFFPRFRDHLFGIASETEFCKAIVCDLVLEELDVDYKTIMTQNVTGLHFLPGKKPVKFPILTNYGHRKYNKNSDVFLSRVDNNRVVVQKIKPDADYEDITVADQTIDLYKYPDTYKPIQMHWENQNLAPDWFTFAGDYTVTANFTHITSKNVLNSLTEKFDTTKVKKLTINSGFILRHELPMLEEMVMQRLVFMNIEGKVYQAFNTTEKLVLQASGQTVIDRDLEFLIVEQ